MCKPKSERHAAALRIFTRRRAAFSVTHRGYGGRPGACRSRPLRWRLEEKVGHHLCVERIEKHLGNARFALRCCLKMGQRHGARIANSLGLEIEEIAAGSTSPPCFSAGVPFYLVPVRDPDCLRRIKLERSRLGRGLSGWQELGLRVHRDSNETGKHFAARMFRRMGIGEDPATGAAAAALIGLIARHAPRAA